MENVRGHDSVDVSIGEILPEWIIYIAGYAMLHCNEVKSVGSTV
jgi:hypothetical protein